MTDKFETHAAGLTAPAGSAAAVAPDDGTDLGTMSRALYVGTPGDLRVTLRDGGVPVTFAALPAGWHPLRVRRVWASGTSAADIVAVW